MQYCRRFNDAPSERYQVINPDAPLLTLMEYSTKASDVSEILSGSIDLFHRCFRILYPTFALATYCAAARGLTTS
jgi:hypothetical protein